MAAWTQSSGTVITQATVTHPSTASGTEVACATWDSVTLFLYWCSLEATANTNPGEFIIMGDSGTLSANDSWAELMRIGTNTDTGTSEVISNESESGPTIEVASTTGFTAGDWLYARDLGAESGSGFRLITSVVSNTSVTVHAALDTALNAAGGDLLWATAFAKSVVINTAGLNKLNVFFDHNGATAANGVVKVEYLGATAFA